MGGPDGPGLSLEGSSSSAVLFPWLRGGIFVLRRRDLVPKREAPSSSVGLSLRSRPPSSAVLGAGIFVLRRRDLRPKGDPFFVSRPVTHSARCAGSARSRPPSSAIKKVPQRQGVEPGTLYGGDEGHPISRSACTSSSSRTLIYVRLTDAFFFRAKTKIPKYKLLKI